MVLIDVVLDVVQYTAVAPTVSFWLLSTSTKQFRLTGRSGLPRFDCKSGIVVNFSLLLECVVHRKLSHTVLGPF